MISEKEHDETDYLQRRESSEMILDEGASVGQIPIATKKRRSTMMTEMTV